jgi:hypothetical protein
MVERYCVHDVLIDKIVWCVLQRILMNSNVDSHIMWTFITIFLAHFSRYLPVSINTLT